MRRLVRNREDLGPSAARLTGVQTVCCRECAGKGYRLLVNGKEFAPRLDRVQQLCTIDRPKNNGVGVVRRAAKKDGRDDQSDQNTLMSMAHDRTITFQLLILRASYVLIFVRDRGFQKRCYCRRRAGRSCPCKSLR